MHCKSFPPVAARDAKILILGSIPSVKSLQKQEYYGHPKNAFWWIIGELLGFDFQLPYELRKSHIIKHKIALWDVLQQCERQGSLDSAIAAKSIKPNDFKTFFSEHRKIRKVLFNGAKAESEFRKRVIANIAELFPEITYHRLPSTSPAMASLSKPAKLAEWRKILE